MSNSDPNNQVGDDELEIGMATHLLLIENEDTIAGTQLEEFFHCCTSLLSEDCCQNPNQISLQ